MRSLLASLLTVLLMGGPAVARPTGSSERQAGPRGSADRVAGPTGSGSPLGGFPGMVGAAGNDATVAAIKALDDLAVYPTGNRYYASCNAGGVYALGNDSNDGLSPSTPFLTWDKLASTMEANVPSWGTLDVEPADCFTLGAGQDFNGVTGEAFNSERLLWRFDSSVPGSRFVITQTGTPTTGLAHIRCDSDVYQDCDGRVVVVDMEGKGFTTGGWIVDGPNFGGLNIKWTSGDGATAEDMVRVAGDSRGFCINCEGKSYNGSIFTMLEVAQLTLIGDGRFEMGTPGSSTAGVIANTGGSYTGAPTPYTSGLTIIDHDVYVPPTSTGAVTGIVRNNPTTNVDILARTQLSKVLIHGADASTGVCLRSDRTNVASSLLKAYQVTTNDCDRVYGVFISNLGLPESNNHTEIQWSILDGGTGQTNLFHPDYQGEVEVGTWIVANSIVNERSGGASTNRYRRNDNTTNASVSIAALIADFDADGAGSYPAYASGSQTGNLFRTGITVDAGGTTQFSGSHKRCIDLYNTPACSAPSTPATSGSPDGLCDDAATHACATVNETSDCQAGQECATVAGSPTYTVDLYGEIWQEVLPGATSDLTSVVRTVTKYGAR